MTGNIATPDNNRLTLKEVIAADLLLCQRRTRFRFG